MNKVYYRTVIRQPKVAVTCANRIGVFFKYTQNSRQRQELIVVATPHLVRPMDSNGMPQLPGAATAHLDPSFGDILLNAKPLDQVVRDYGLAR